MLKPLANNLKSNSNASGENGGKGADIFASICHTNQLVPNAIYLLSICLLINGANASAVYVYSIQLPNPKNKSDINITPKGNKNAKLFLVR